MADTLLTVAQRVARKVGIDPTFTSFSNSDDTNDIVQYINDAYQDLLDALPDDCPYLLDTSRTLSLSNGTRLYSLYTDARHFSILDWSFINTTSNSAPITVTTLQAVQEIDELYTSRTGVPEFVYREGNEQVGFYPIPDGSYTVSYKFSKPFSRLSATSDSFLVPDHWLRYVEDKAAYYYQERKGFQDTELLLFGTEQKLVAILTEADLMNPHYFYSEDI